MLDKTAWVAVSDLIHLKGVSDLAEEFVKASQVPP